MHITEYIEKNPGNRYLLLLDSKGEIIEGEIDTESLTDIFLAEEAIGKTAIVVSINSADFCNTLLGNLKGIQSYHLSKEK